MADSGGVPFATNLLPQYQSPQQMALMGAQTQNLQANAQNSQASAGYTNTQNQGADIANQQAALNLQLYKQALNAPPIGNPNALPGGNLLGGLGGAPAPATGGTPGKAGPGSDAFSGTTGGASAPPIGAAPNGAPPTATPNTAPAGTPNSAPAASGPGPGISPDHPADYPAPADLMDKAQARYQPTVQPFTDDERVQIMQGLASPNPYIKQRTQAFVDARTSAVNANNAQKNQLALQEYNAMSSVAARDDGTSFTLMDRYNHEAAQAIARRYPNDFVTDTNGQITATDKGEADMKAYATSMAGIIHPFTGRGIDVTPAGVVVDKVDGKPVTGVNQVTNLGGKEIADIAAKGHAKVDTLINGQPAQLEQWQMDKAPDYSSWLQTQLDQAKRGIQPSATSAQPPASSPGTATAPPTAAPQNAAPKATPAAQPPSAAGGSSTPSVLPNGLAGVDISTLPKRQVASVPQGQSMTAEQKASNDRDQAQTTAQLQAASESSANDAKMRSLLNAANGEIAKINPRTVGPGSDFYNSYLKFKAGVTGGSPNDLVNEQELDKFLNQVGAQNVRTMLSGQKITNQEMMTFMTRGSPNTEQSVQTIKNLVNYLNADNEYDSKLQSTKIAALQKGADPWKINDSLETASPRTNYIQGRTGFALRGPGQSNPSPSGASGKTVTRSGMLNGKKVVQYSDGSTAYAQ